MDANSQSQCACDPELEMPIQPPTCHNNRGHRLDACSQDRMQVQYLCCGASAVALLAAREAMPGSCCTLADAEVDVELGREMGSFGGGGST